MLDGRDGLLLLLGRLEEEEEADGGDASDGEVHVEAPPPSCLYGEGAADEGAGY